MIKWGDYRDVDVRLLEKANGVLLKQQKLAGGSSDSPQFSAGSIISQNAAIQGLTHIQDIGPIRVCASVGINNWMLGYLYRLAEEGHLQKMMEQIEAESKGGADESDGTVRRDGTGDHRPPETDRA